MRERDWKDVFVDWFAGIALVVMTALTVYGINEEQAKLHVYKQEMNKWVSLDE